MTARDKPTRKSRLLPLTVLLAAALALLYFLRFGDFGIGVGVNKLLDQEQTAPQIDASNRIDATVEDVAALPPCRILINAEGLSADGVTQTLDEVVSACTEAGVAELVVAGDATVGQLDETKAALKAAAIEVREVHKQAE